jgi:IS30 family transposase
MARIFPACQLTETEIHRIRKLLEDSELSLKQIAERFGRCTETIRQVNLRFNVRPAKIRRGDLS